ncbi:hypothetical protein KSP40_PGU017298 [Platanthera guangdongensis]|uniref:Uncharacterized protein n=1 Tax=Platanthera guangdongensis TaxID=2320717 RepID=A0ABR2LDQ5_9ASPA
MLNILPTSVNSTNIFARPSGHCRHRQPTPAALVLSVYSLLELDDGFLGSSMHRLLLTA